MAGEKGQGTDLGGGTYRRSLLLALPHESRPIFKELVLFELLPFRSRFDRPDARPVLGARRTHLPRSTPVLDYALLLCLPLVQMQTLILFDLFLQYLGYVASAMLALVSKCLLSTSRVASDHI
jgi:hypothetical protein